MSTEERWEYIKGTGDRYMISNFGRVRSMWKYVNKSKIIKREEYIRKPVKDKDGYETVMLHNNGKSKNVKVHRLVAEYFIPNPENKPTVNHIDGNKSNNHISNLEWATNHENNLHKVRVLKKYRPITDELRMNISKGLRNSSKVKRKAVLCVELNKEYASVADACRDMNTDWHNINRCCKNETGTACGYHWKFITR